MRFERSRSGFCAPSPSFVFDGVSSVTLSLALDIHIRGPVSKPEAVKQGGRRKKVKMEVEGRTPSSSWRQPIGARQSWMMPAAASQRAHLNGLQAVEAEHTSAKRNPRRDVTCKTRARYTPSYDPPPPPPPTWTILAPEHGILRALLTPTTSPTTARRTSSSRSSRRLRLTALALLHPYNL